MMDMPEFAPETLEAGEALIHRYFDNQDLCDDIQEIAERDPNFPHLDIPDNDEDLTMQQEDANTEFVDALDALLISKFAVVTFSPIKDFFDNIREALEVYNAPDMLNGYLNPILDQVNPIFSLLGMTTISPIPDDDLTTD